MAENKAIEYIDAQITKLQDQRKQADAVLAASVKDHAEKTGRIDQEIADWGDILDRFYGTQDVKPRRAAKKTADPAK